MADHLHPEKTQLRDYLLGKLPQESLDEVAAHLDGCPHCEDTVASLDSVADTFVSQVATPPATAGDEDDTRMREALQFVANLDRPATSAQLAATDAPLGRIGAYQLLAKLGEGGMGTVYKAMHAKLEKIVALKVMVHGKTTTPQAVARFEREMKAVGKLEHPHLIRAHDAGEIDGTHYLVMEYAAGEDLASLVNERGQIPVAEACELIRQAALGLQCAHEHGMVHRDIKPSNLILTREGRVKVLDLGLALLSDRQEAAELTSEGQVMGTIDYMAPEQAQSSHEVDIRADIYSLGATLYKLLTGQAPFAGQAYDSTVKKVLALATARPAPLSAQLPGVPAALSNLVERLLAKTPNERPAEPIDVARALEPFAAGADVVGLLAEGDTPRSTTASAMAATSPTVASVAPRVAIDPAARVRGAAPPRNRRPALLIGGMAGFAALVFGVILIIRDKDGNEKGRIALEPGDRFEVAEGAAEPAKKDPAKTDAAKTALAKTDSVKTPAAKAGPAPTVSRKGLVADKEKPFVVVRAKTGEKVGVSTLARAVEMRAGDDVVEVHGNGPFRTGMVRVKGNLTLRAAPGYRPQFKAALQTYEAILAVEDGNLLVEGCDFRCPLIVSGAFFSGTGSSWEFRNCRILGGVGTPFRYDGPRLRLEDCLISFTSPFGGGAWIELIADKLQWEMKNCVIRNSGRELFPLGPKSQWTVKLHNNTIINQGTFVMDLAERKGARLDVEAEGNIFQLNESNGNFYAAANVQTWKDKVSWQGKDNLYVGPREGLAWSLDEKGEKKTYGLAGWNEFWQEEEKGSLESPVFYPGWREPYLAQEPDALVAALRAYAATQHASQGVEFQTAGPDWKLVGPGEAYVRALEAQGTPVPKEALRPKAVEGAPFVILREGKVASAFDQLSLVLAAAQDGDIVELRTDDSIPAASLPAPKKTMALTIRAAAGYLPVIEGNAPWIVPGIRLTVEGLHFRKGSLNLGDHSETGRNGRLVRMANCSFAADGAADFNFMLGNPWSFPQLQTEGATEVVNCAAPWSISIYTESKGRLRIVNSVVGNLVNIYPPGDENHFLEIDHSIVWTPATFKVPSSTISGGQHDVEGPLTLPQVTLRDSIIDNSATLIGFGSPALKIAGWHGERNVFALGEGYWYSIYAAEAPKVGNLGVWQTLWDSDHDSIQIDPIIYDPQAWKLIDGTPGSKARADGTDLGADVSRIGIRREAAPDDDAAPADGPVKEKE